MRFCMITTFYPPYAFGGDAVFIYRLSNLLARRGHEVDVIHCLDSYNALAKGPLPSGYRNEPGVTLHGLNSRWGTLSPLTTYLTGYPFLKRRKIQRILASKSFDVIHFHNISLIGGPKILAFGKGIKLYTMHEHWLICPTHVLYKFNKEICTKKECFRCQLSYRRPPQLWRYTGMLEKALRHVDSFIAPSRFTLERHLAEGLPIEPAYLPYFFEENGTTPAVSFSSGRIRFPSRPFFLFAGRLEKLKGLQTVLPLFKSYPAADLVVAGDGSYAEELRKQAAGCDRIHFLGRLNYAELEEAYRRSIALLVPSVSFDVSPMVIGEAFKMRTPVIVRGLGSLPEIIEESGGGLVFQNDQELLEAMERLRTDPVLRNQLGESGYRTCSSRWTADKHLEQYLHLIEEIREQKTKKRIPSGPPAYPVLGHTVDFLSDKIGFLMKCAADYGDVVKLKIGEPTYLLNHPEDIKHVLETNYQKYEKTPRLASQSGRRLSGDGLLTSSAATHRENRQMLQPLFLKPAFSSFAEVMVQCTQEMLSSWKEGESRDIASEMMTLAHRILGKMLFSLDFMNEAKELGEAFSLRRKYIHHSFESFFPFPDFFPTPLNRSYRRAMKRIDHALNELIRERRHSLNPSHDLLSLLMQMRDQNGVLISDKQIRDEALTISVTGYETLGEALAWTWYLLSQHPEAERELQAEVKNVLDGRPPHTEDLPKLRYTEMVLAESMRLYPPTWIFIRIAREADRLPSGVTIPQGSKLYLCPYVMHRHPRYFPEPDRFDPGRFSDAAKRNRPKFAYFPFGGGPRVCIGQGLAMMEGVLVLASITQRFRFTLLPDQKVIPEPKVTLRSGNGIKMRIHAQSNETLGNKIYENAAHA